MQEDRKAFFQLILFCVLILGSVGTFNTVVDPFGDSKYISSVYKPLVNERIYKYDDFFRKKKDIEFETVFIGSSTSLQFDPEQIPKLKSYNLSVSNLRLQEAFYLIQEAHTKKGIKKIIYGVGFSDFNKNFDGLNTNAKFLFSTPRTVSPLSFETLQLSVKTLRNFLNDKQQGHFSKKGMLLEPQRDKLRAENPAYFSDENWSNDVKKRFEFLFQSSGADFELNENALSYLKKLKYYCEKNGIELITFIPPVSVEFFKKIGEQEKLFTDYLRIKKELSNIFGGIWDFSEPSIVTTDRSNFYDSVHADKKIYRAILETIISRRRKIEGFGKYIEREGRE